MTKQLYTVTVETEVLVWADDEIAAEALAQDAGLSISDMDFRASSANPDHHMAETPVGAGVTVRSLLAAGDRADDDDLREAWPATLKGKAWYTDGYAAFPALLPCWILRTDRTTADLDKAQHVALHGLADKTLPVVEMAWKSIQHHGLDVHPFSTTLALDARYVQAVRDRHPNAAWHHNGSWSAAVAVDRNRVVAIVMPVKTI